MKKIKIITDTTAYISKEDAILNDIGIVPMTYIINGKEEKEGYPGEFDEFFKGMEDGSIEVTTSQPAVGDFIEAFEKAFEEGYDQVLALVMSSKVSGTYNSAKLAKETLANDRIKVVDSLTSSGNMKKLVFDSLLMVKEGKNIEEIIKYIEEKRKKARVFIVADSLKYLEKSGRISKLGMLMGNLLNVKPIIEMKDGEMGLGGKARGKKQAFSKVLDMIPDDTEKISVCPIYAKQDGEKLYELMLKRFPQIHIEIEEIGIVVGCHVGPKSMGICII